MPVPERPDDYVVTPPLRQLLEYAGDMSMELAELTADFRDLCEDFRQAALKARALARTGAYHTRT